MALGVVFSKLVFEDEGAGGLVVSVTFNAHRHRGLDPLMPIHCCRQLS